MRHQLTWPGLLALLLTRAATGQELIAVSPSFTAEWIAATTPIELSLSATPAPEIGNIAVFIGKTDVSALFTRQAERLIYRPRVMPLPPG